MYVLIVGGPRKVLLLLLECARAFQGVCVRRLHRHVRRQDGLRQIFAQGPG